MTAAIAERVAAGAAWLDEQRPGWWRDVDLGTLDLADPCLCVLGQVYAEAADPYDDPSGYHYALDFEHAPNAEGGFHIGWFVGSVNPDDGHMRTSSEAHAAFAELGTAWKQLIAERRAAA